MAAKRAETRCFNGLFTLQGCQILGKLVGPDTKKAIRTSLGPVDTAISRGLQSALVHRRGGTQVGQWRNW